MKAPTQAQLYRAIEAYDDAMHNQAPTLPARILAMRAALQAAAHPPAAKPACGAVQEQDEMACGRCGLRWGVEEEPACRGPH